jgi:hypothetical protein
MSVVISGAPVAIPGLTTVSWLEETRLRLGREDFAPRRPSSRIQQIILHTTKGLPAGPRDLPQDIRPGFGPAVNAGERCALYWSHDGRNAGAHLVVDQDGTIACCADLLTDAAYHATVVNQRSIGIEIYQGAAAELYAGQLHIAVTLVDWLTRRFGIQRQIPAHYAGLPIPRLVQGGIDCVGVFGHRDVTSTRGAGDPGSEIFHLLSQAGYEAWDFAANEDLAVWRQRQAYLHLQQDGVPGPITLAALVAAKQPAGMWIERPGDDAPLAAAV